MNCFTAVESVSDLMFFLIGKCYGGVGLEKSERVRFLKPSTDEVLSAKGMALLTSVM